MKFNNTIKLHIYLIISYGLCNVLSPCDPQRSIVAPTFNHCASVPFSGGRLDSAEKVRYMT